MCCLDFFKTIVSIKIHIQRLFLRRIPCFLQVKSDLCGQLKQQYNQLQKQQQQQSSPPSWLFLLFSKFQQPLETTESMRLGCLVRWAGRSWGWGWRWACWKACGCGWAPASPAQQVQPSRTAPIFSETKKGQIPSSNMLVQSSLLIFSEKRNVIVQKYVFISSTGYLFRRISRRVTSNYHSTARR